MLVRIPSAAPAAAALALCTAAVEEVSEYTGVPADPASDLRFVGVVKAADSAAVVVAFLVAAAAGGGVVGLAVAVLLLALLALEVDKRTSPLRLRDAGPEIDSLLDLWW